jgi:hypothetical protein
VAPTGRTVTTADPKLQIKLFSQINCVSTSPALEVLYCYWEKHHYLAIPYPGSCWLYSLDSQSSDPGTGPSCGDPCYPVQLAFAFNWLLLSDPVWFHLDRHFAKEFSGSCRFLSMSTKSSHSPFGLSEGKETTENLYNLGLITRSDRPQRSLSIARGPTAQSGHPGKTIDYRMTINGQGRL